MEAVAAVSFAASLVTLLDTSAKVLTRLNEYSLKSHELPESLRHIKAELPLLRTTFNQLHDSTQTGVVREDVQKAILPILSECDEQIAKLDELVSRVLPTVDKSWLEKRKKAICSLQQDTRLERIRSILRSYINVLAFYNTAVTSTSQSSKGPQ